MTSQREHTRKETVVGVLALLGAITVFFVCVNTFLFDGYFFPAPVADFVRSLFHGNH